MDLIKSSFLKLVTLPLIILSIGSAYGIPQSAFAQKLISAARQQIGVTVIYDPTYRRISYPLGDVPKERGVCTDVIVRALRQQGIDLQQAIHEHSKKYWHKYPKKWGLSKPDSNIDHRRVPNIMTYLLSKGCAIDINPEKERYIPGDIVVLDLGHGILHIGILSNTFVPATDRYYVIHNICCGVKEEDIFADYKIVGHFRIDENSLKS